MQKRCHHHRAQDLADGVPASQYGDGAGEAEQASGSKGHRADADEGGPEEERPDERRDGPRSHCGQGDSERLHSHAHSAADGTAANPTTSHAPLPPDSAMPSPTPPMPMAAPNPAAPCVCIAQACVGETH